MPLTVEMITALIAIGGPVLALAFGAWKMIEKKVNESLTGVKLEVDNMKKERTNLLADRKAVEADHARRLESLEKNTVTREDYVMDRESTNRAIESIALTLRETTSTITSRIDLVLFEIGRQKHGEQK